MLLVRSADWPRRVPLRRTARCSRACADLLALMIENARLTSPCRRHRKRCRRDIALASEVQRRLLPDAPPRPRRRSPGRGQRTRPPASAATTTISSSSATAASASRSPTSRERASPPPSSWPSCRRRCGIIASEGQVRRRRSSRRGSNEFLHRSTGRTAMPRSSTRSSTRARGTSATSTPGTTRRICCAPATLRCGIGSSDSSLRSESCPLGGTVLGLFPGMSYEEATVDLRPGRCARRLHRRRHRGAQRGRAGVRRGAAEGSPPLRSRRSTGARDFVSHQRRLCTRGSPARSSTDDMTFVVMKVGAASSDAVLSDAG